MNMPCSFLAHFAVLFSFNWILSNFGVVVLLATCKPRFTVHIGIANYRNDFEILKHPSIFCSLRTVIKSRFYCSVVRIAVACSTQGLQGMVSYLDMRLHSEDQAIWTYNCTLRRWSPSKMFLILGERPWGWIFPVMLSTRDPFSRGEQRWLCQFFQ